MPNFPTDKCPMCNENLIKNEKFGLLVYECPTPNNINFLNASKGHYKVHSLTNGMSHIQYAYIFPYSIDTFEDHDNKTRIYKWAPQPTEENPNQGWWDFIIEVSQIKITTADKLLNRIKTLLNYL